jgi:hypothetical protein
MKPVLGNVLRRLPMMSSPQTSGQKSIIKTRPINPERLYPSTLKELFG